MNHAQSSIFTGISYSYITLIDEYLNLLNNTLYSSLEYLDKDVYALTKEMHTLFSTLPSLLNGDGEFKETYAHKLIEFRETLEHKYRTLSAYRRELGHLTTCCNIKSGLSHEDLSEAGFDADEPLDLDFDLLAKDCAHFVFHENTNEARQEKATLILPFIPMRMTKDSFLNYTTRAINHIHIEDTPQNVEFLISILSQLLDGHFYEGFGRDFKDLSISLEELKGYKDDDFFENAELVDETITTCIKAVSSLYKMICTFGNLLIFDSMNFESLCELHISYYDFYCTIEKILEGNEDADLFLNTLPERVTEIKEAVESSYKKATAMKDMDPLFALIQTYLAMDISHIFGFDSGKSNNYSRNTENMLRDFQGHMREYLGGLTPGERKLRMQYFISILPFIMDEKTFYDYVMHGFNNIANPKHNLITAVYLSNVMESSGYFESDQSEDDNPGYVLDESFEENMLHAHDHDDCDCGHDHSHHSHDCNCDHDDPDHDCNCNHDHPNA
ncbi:MAG: hypothetical protein AB9856_05255 [Cellulosilyticaceae bacterium]